MRLKNEGGNFLELNFFLTGVIIFICVVILGVKVRNDPG